MTKFKNYYFIYYLAYLIAANYLTVYTTSIGFSPADAAFFASFNLLLAATGQFIFSAYADKIKNHKSILKILTLSVVVLAILFPLSSNYYFVYLMSGLFGFTQRAMIPVFDTMSSNIAIKKQQSFSSLRAWGAYGAAVAASIAFIFDYIEVSIIFYMFAVFHMYLYFIINKIEKEEFESKKTLEFKHIKKIFLNKTFVSIIIVNFILYGIIMLVTNTGSFVIPYLEETISVFYVSMFLFLSITGFVRIFFEGLVMEFKKLFIKEENIIRGLQIATLFTVIRLEVLSLQIDSLLLYLMTGFMQGVTLGIMTPGIIYYISKNMPEEIKTTSMSIYAISISMSGYVFNKLLGHLLINDMPYQKIIFLLIIISLIPFVIIIENKLREKYDK